MTRLLFAASMLLAIAGCAVDGGLSSSPVASSPVPPTSTIPATPTPTRQWLRCSTDIVFQASALSGPLEPSAAQDKAAVIFRRFPAPPDSWRRLIDNDKRVVFAAANPSDWEGNFGGGTGGAGNLRFVDVANIDGAWRVAANGDCWPRVVLEGDLQSGNWALATVSDDARQLELLVTQFEECTSGQPPGNRVQPPVIVETDDDVTITFGIEPLGGSHDCQGAPGTLYRVTLGAPLGQRVLHDGSYFPPRVVDAPG